MVEASPRFREWYGSLAPESEKLPLGAWSVTCARQRPRGDTPTHRRTLTQSPTQPNYTEWAGLDRTPLLKMLVVRCLRPDRMTVALTNFIRDVLPNGARAR